MSKIPKKHVFVCINCRESSRKSCGDKGLEIRTELVRIASQDDSDQPLRINKRGCLDACEHGPALVIYPNAIWYKNVDISDCKEIYDKSIKSDEIVDRLLLKEKDINATN